MINFEFGCKDEFSNLRQAHNSALQAVSREFKRMTDVLFETYPNLKSISWGINSFEVCVNAIVRNH
jgi:hypothetical protein